MVGVFNFALVPFCMLYLPHDSSSPSSVHDVPLFALVLVLTVPDGVGTQVNVPLTCGKAFQDQSVFWKKDGKETVRQNHADSHASTSCDPGTAILLGLELIPAVQGNQVKVLVMEMDGGNYTCHNRSNGQYLNHTLIMIQLEHGSRTVILEKKSPQGK